MKMKNKNGITLIALVITIIILLILAGVAVSIGLSGDNLFSKANEAKTGWNEKSAEEENRLRNYFEYLDIEKQEMELSIISKETESRAVKLNVMLNGVPTMEEWIKAMSPDELKSLLAKSLYGDEADWSDIESDYSNTYTDVKDFYDRECSDFEYNDEYDYIINGTDANWYYEQEYNKITYTCTGNEPISGKKAEFIITNPGTYVITASKDGEEYGRKEWKEYPSSKIETFSDIQTSNYTLKKDNYDVVVPAGFAYGTSPNVGTVTTGLVITDSVDENGNSNGNEFVWIPIDKTNLTIGKTDKKMAEMSSETDYKGILYNLELDPTGNTIIDPETFNANLPQNAYEATSNVYGKEPIAVSSDSSNGINQTSMQNDYNAMIASIKKYGGFYVARYEMGRNDLSKLGVWPVSSHMDEANGWYGLYSKAKLYANPNNYNSVTSGMIWGSQYDAMLIYSISNTANSGKIMANTNGNHSGSVVLTGLYEGADSINNIYDLEGNMWEFTQELSDFSCRSLRGGYYQDTWFHPVSRDGRISGFNYAQTDSTRVMLYINV